MADVVYRGNLKAASFPFLSELFGRSIIVKGQDQNYIGGLATKETLDSAIGVPQIYYCHNVIPTDNGYKSVSFKEVVTPAYPVGTNFNRVVTLRDAAGNSAHLATDISGNLYILQEGTTTWTTVGGAPAAATIAGKRLTIAFVSGVTYLYFATIGCYSYDFGTNTLTAETLASLTASAILGITANRGYMIAYSADAVAWSSIVDPTDFLPDLATGAGGGQLEGARGEIVTIESVYGGMIAFTAGNAIAAIASDNSRFPYNFTEITGSGGLPDPEFVSYDSTSGVLYAYTTAGIQSINLKSATVIFPEATDFISGGLFEDYNELTNELELIGSSGAVLEKRLHVAASRYLILSYGIGALTHALFYDISYKQWGRLKFPHTDCFEFLRTTVETAKNSVAFLTGGGGVYTLNTDIINTEANGVLLLGKFQYVRSRLLTLEGVEIENINQGDTFNLYDLPALDGKNFGAALVGYLHSSVGKLRNYLFHNTSINHTLVWKGAFNAVSVVLTFKVNGSR